MSSGVSPVISELSIAPSLAVECVCVCVVSWSASVPVVSSWSSTGQDRVETSPLAVCLHLTVDLLWSPMCNVTTSH